jgi:isopentenyldiphosphate isomerase
MPADEPVDLVDELDRVVGSAKLRECLERGLLHRAVAVLVLRPGGKVLLQQRSKRDAWHPGMWTLSCTGHVTRGESYRKAALRELGEELGIRPAVRESMKLLLPAMTDGRLTEREWVTLFTAESAAPVSVDPVELEGTREVPVSELAGLLRGRKLTPDAKILLAAFLSGGLQPEGPKGL